jgi:hypothetical protein
VIIVTEYLAVQLPRVSIACQFQNTTSIQIKESDAYLLAGGTTGAQDIVFKIELSDSLRLSFSLARRAIEIAYCATTKPIMCSGKT